ncbi:hypothetical protein ACA910_009252 [Epithemia clementina (nom. ined.)]
MSLSPVKESGVDRVNETAQSLKKIASAKDTSSVDETAKRELSPSAPKPGTKKPEVLRDDEKDQKLPATSTNEKATTTLSTKPKKNQGAEKRKRNKLLQDCISVEIPLNFTADLGLAWRHTRKKRIVELLESYPALVAAAAASINNNNETQGDAVGDSDRDSGKDDDDDNGELSTDDPSDNKANGRGKVEKKKATNNAPNRRDFSNMVDYLEAKYAKGVMVEDGLAAAERNDGDDNDKGSVYSETSWIDDSDLKRDVAEQVLGHTTKTKLELTTDDSEFFVNVGTLEVEETEQTKDHYDPLKDIDRDENKKPSRPRKKAATSSGATTATQKKPVVKKVKSSNSTTDACTATMKTKSSDNADGKESVGKTKQSPSADAPTKKDAPISLPPKKKAKKVESSDTKQPASPVDRNQPPPTISSSNTKERPPSPPKKEDRLQTIANRQQAKIEAEKKVAMEKAYAVLVAMIKTLSEDEIPRRKTKDKVALTCPADKKPGDSILFENPHVKGQRLKVKIPKNTLPGGIFKVTVPVPKEPVDDGEGGETDHNRWSREFYETLSDYAYHYDVWIDAVAERHVANGNKEFSGHFEKRKKFDELVYVFPKDLKSPIDKAYMQKILRRARQNKHKRDKTAKRLEERAKELSSTSSLTGQNDHDQDDDLQDSVSVGSGGKGQKAKGEALPPVRRSEPLAPPRLSIKLPPFTTKFGKRPFVANDFV